MDPGPFASKDTVFNIICTPDLLKGWNDVEEFNVGDFTPLKEFAYVDLTPPKNLMLVILLHLRI